MAESKPGPAPPQGGDGPPESRLQETYGVPVRQQLRFALE